jgi:hypothetical protein
VDGHGLEKYSQQLGEAVADVLVLTVENVEAVPLLVLVHETHQQPTARLSGWTKEERSHRQH